jgi:F0F1-type ATP synthase assembly protein I
MANPNIVNVTSIYGNTAYVIPSTTSATATWTHNGTTALTGLTPAANTVNRVTQITVTNVTAGAVLATVAISNNATYASGTPYYLAYQISIPANAALTVIDKTTSFYVTENQSVGVITGTGSALNFVATFEAIS